MVKVILFIINIVLVWNDSCPNRNECVKIDVSNIILVFCRARISVHINTDFRPTLLHLVIISLYICHILDGIYITIIIGMKGLSIYIVLLISALLLFRSYNVHN